MRGRPPMLRRGGAVRAAPGAHALAPRGQRVSSLAGAIAGAEKFGSSQETVEGLMAIA
ncbi:hypothetical protein I6G56_08130 [Burkholderia humptydooensis]|uniref:Uncharacterized protein n=2 Tax=Burkholderia humptydooensis TaxID=430531 RepID=A0A7T2WYD5_9BURK|nr:MULTISPECIES: hypothetical protein [Burkholderia]EIP87301.1 hypothetical protein A33K_15317 [Burkholderia humptydooensis MSMB43]QPS45011.1 hypothetical protein I6G56_08130 [Burkholderia humptydooensis]